MLRRIMAPCLFAFLMITFVQQANAEVAYEQLLKVKEFPVGVLLQWSTSYEFNNKMFVIEKSNNGTDFTTLGAIESRGNKEGTNNYRFLDTNTQGKAHFYRLKQVDEDDAFTYTEPVSITTKIPDNFDIVQLSDVTTVDYLGVTIDAFSNGLVRYSLADWKSNTILEGEMLVASGMNQLDIDLADYKTGIYKLSLKMDGEEETITLKRITDGKEKRPMASTKKLDKN